MECDYIVIYREKQTKKKTIIYNNSKY